MQMSRLPRAVVTLFAVLIVGCTAPAPITESSPPQPQPAPAPVERPPSAAIAKADRLIAEMRAREDAQAKLDRENPPPPPPRLEDVLRATAPMVPASSPAAVQPPSVTPSTPVTTAPTVAARDEHWWKNEMRQAEVRLMDNQRRLQEATDQQRMASRQMDAAVKASPVVFAQAQEAFNRASSDVSRLQAEVRNDQAAVTRIREDARRASVPPGWLRWRQ